MSNTRKRSERNALTVGSGIGIETLEGRQTSEVDKKY